MNPELVLKEKEVILERLKKAGNFAKWGEGRKWTATEIPNQLEPSLAAEITEAEVEHDVHTLTVGAAGFLKVFTDSDEGKVVEVVRRDDGSVLLRPIEYEQSPVNDGALLDRESSLDTSTSSATFELDTLRVASSPIRLRILDRLRRGESNVGDLCNNLGDVKQPAVSHHLMLLRIAGLIDRRRAGQCAYYSLTPNGRDFIKNLPSRR
jgi:DNA-binding transcriptional ArsR family regulator